MGAATFPPKKFRISEGILGGRGGIASEGVQSQLQQNIFCQTEDEVVIMSRSCRDMFLPVVVFEYS